MRVVVTGADGMLGRAVTRHFTGAGDHVIPLVRAQLDIADRSSVAETLHEHRPDYVINCAAYTDVDGCETDDAQNNSVNGLGPGNLALATRESGAGLITISTDYVFNGSKEGFYTQRDTPDPLSAYGRAKLHGERLAQVANARTIVVRVGWLFGEGGRNFLSRVPGLVAGGTPAKAINDCFGTPTYAPDMSRRLRELALLDLPGIYHMANSGEGTSFAGFVRAAGGVADEVPAETLKRPALRPRNSRLRCLMQEALKLEPLRDWREALEQFIGRTG